MILLLFIIIPCWSSSPECSWRGVSRPQVPGCFLFSCNLLVSIRSRKTLDLLDQQTTLSRPRRSSQHHRYPTRKVFLLSSGPAVRPRPHVIVISRFPSRTGHIFRHQFHAALQRVQARRSTPARRLHPRRRRNPREVRREWSHSNGQ